MTHLRTQSLPRADTAADCSCLGPSVLCQIRPHLGGNSCSCVSRATGILLDSALLGLDSVLLGAEKDGHSPVLLSDANVVPLVCDSRVLVAVLSSPEVDDINKLVSMSMLNHTSRSL
jgi:hypothetical protein